MDRAGTAATHTGPECQAWAGGKTGPGYAAQGNILTGPEVVEAMANAFERTSGFLGDRLMAALEAGDAAGGDSRGRQAAAIYLASAGRGYGGGNDVLCDLRVDDHASPIEELRRVYLVWRPTQLILDGYDLLEQGKFADAIAHGEEAARLDAVSGSPNYHLACYLSRAGKSAEALHQLEIAVSRDAALRAAAAADPDLVPLHARPEWKRLISGESP